MLEQIKEDNLKKKKHTVPEIVIPVGYDIADILDMDDSDFGDEQPILIEEVKLRFERNGNEQ